MYGRRCTKFVKGKVLHTQLRIFFFFYNTNLCHLKCRDFIFFCFFLSRLPRTYNEIYTYSRTIIRVSVNKSHIILNRTMKSFYFLFFHLFCIFFFSFFVRITSIQNGKLYIHNSMLYTMEYKACEIVFFFLIFISLSIIIFVFPFMYS